MSTTYGGASQSSQSIDREFHSLAHTLAQLLEEAGLEIERDWRAAKASLATARSILRLEIERRSSPDTLRNGGLAGWQIARVQSFIEQNLHRPILTTELSAVAQRSTTHFSRSFKLAFGVSPHAYIIRRRLDGACHLMLTSPASLSEIALDVGLSDQAHLCKLFRRAFGQSPANWRREREVRYH